MCYYEIKNYKIILIGVITMECPYCKKTMKKGSIHCHNGWFPMVWRAQEDESTRKIQSWYKNFTATKLEDVYYCSDCEVILKKVTIDKK